MLARVESAEHLGHTLHQSVTMDKDCLRARARFIDKTVEVREKFAFAHPSQTIKMVKTLCCDGYGSMLWELKSDPVEQIFKCWNTCVKPAWGVPRSTFTFLQKPDSEQVSCFLQEAFRFSQHGSENPS